MLIIHNPMNLALNIPIICVLLIVGIILLRKTRKKKSDSLRVEVEKLKHEIKQI